MKKLMIAACACALAGMAHAGAMAWSAMNIQASGTTTDKSKATYSGYIFAGTDYKAATSLLVGDSKDLTAFKNAAVGTKTSTYVAATGYLNFVGGAAGSYTSTDVTAFLIIFDAASVDDASNYLVAKVNGTGSEYITQTFGTTGNKPFSWGLQTSNTAWQTMSVPEPTSGLLLLLGMAGLALKRKIA